VAIAGRLEGWATGANGGGLMVEDPRSLHGVAILPLHFGPGSPVSKAFRSKIAGSANRGWPQLEEFRTITSVLPGATLISTEGAERVSAGQAGSDAKGVNYALWPLPGPPAELRNKSTPVVANTSPGGASVGGSDRPGPAPQVAAIAGAVAEAAALDSERRFRST